MSIDEYKERGDICPKCNGMAWAIWFTDAIPYPRYLQCKDSQCKHVEHIEREPL